MERENKKVLIAGSFDPVTNGHVALIEYAAARYSEVFAVIFVNAEKRYLFTEEERLALLEAACAPYENVRVDRFDGMQYLYAKEKKIDFAIRGFRNERDLEYEHVVADFNRKALPGFETILVESKEEERQISSTVIRDLLAQKEDVSPFVPAQTLDLLYRFVKDKKME